MDSNRRFFLNSNWSTKSALSALKPDPQNAAVCLHSQTPSVREQQSWPFVLPFISFRLSLMLRFSPSLSLSIFKKVNQNRLIELNQMWVHFHLNSTLNRWDWGFLTLFAVSSPAPIDQFSQPPCSSRSVVVLLTNSADSLLFFCISFHSAPFLFSIPVMKCNICFVFVKMLSVFWTSTYHGCNHGLLSQQLRHSKWYFFPSVNVFFLPSPSPCGTVFRGLFFTLMIWLCSGYFLLLGCV